MTRDWSDPGLHAQAGALGVKLLAILSLLSATVLPVASRAQIYECAGEDGSRVFSDERCGPDAKVVSGITSRKRQAPDAAGASRPKRVFKAAAELEALSARCDAGDMKACREWTLGGGPNLLREKERRAELECEGGSLTACEERYCKEGFTPDCRVRVLRTAQLAGDDWYLRDEERGRPDGSTRYSVRCVPEKGPPRDITVQCASLAGPNRCYVIDPEQGFPRLDRAAAKHCDRTEGNND